MLLREGGVGCGAQALEAARAAAAERSAALEKALAEAQSRLAEADARAEAAAMEAAEAGKRAEDIERGWGERLERCACVGVAAGRGQLVEGGRR